LQKFKWLKGYLFVLATWGSFFTYLWLQLVQEGPDGLRIGSAYVWADWALHYIVASVAAYRPISCWFTNHPVYLNQMFDYPFVVDFISGLLQRFGTSLGNSFLIPSIIGSLLFVSVIYLFNWGQSKSSYISFTALTLLLLNGGLGFFEIIQEWGRTPHFWQSFPQRLYSQWTDKGYFFGNMTLTEFLPQRAFLLGLPIALIIINSLLKLPARPSRNVKATIAGLGLLAGSLLFIHPHSYLVIVMFSVFLTLMRPRSYRSWIVYAVGAFLPSLIWWTSFHQHGASSGFFTWTPGWMASEPQSGNLGFFKFWFLNWGLFLPVAIWGSLRYRMYRNPVVLFGFILFAICNFVQFQPWSWDNTKLFTYSYLFLALPVAQSIYHLCVDSKWYSKICGTILFLSLILTGAVDIIGILKKANPGYLMYSSSEMALASAVRSKTNACDVILTATDHHHWLPALTGRQILMGYAGWVASYGMDYSAREKDIRTIYSGTNQSLELLRHYTVQYVLIGPKERMEFTPNQSFFDTDPHFELILTQDNDRLYRVKPIN
jgi:hypothetical protein